VCNQVGSMMLPPCPGFQTIFRYPSVMKRSNGTCFSYRLFSKKTCWFFSIATFDSRRVHRGLYHLKQSQVVQFHLAMAPVSTTRMITSPSAWSECKVCRPQGSSLLSRFLSFVQLIGATVLLTWGQNLSKKNQDWCKSTQLWRIST